MGSCYTGDHFAGGHIHTDITTCNTEKYQQKYRLGTVSYRLTGRGGGLGDPNIRPLYLQWFETFGLHEGILIHQ